MSIFTLVQTKDAISVIDSYTQPVSDRLHALRLLIIECAKEIESVTELEETLKWGEPSYLTKNGSTIRLDWKVKKPNQYGLYFKCTSKLVATFKEIYQDTFQYENNRAIIFSLDQDIPTLAVKECIKVALTYHLVKGLPNLGMTV